MEPTNPLAFPPQSEGSPKPQQPSQRPQSSKPIPPAEPLMSFKPPVTIPPKPASQPARPAPVRPSVPPIPPAIPSAKAVPAAPTLPKPPVPPAQFDFSRANAPIVSQPLQLEKVANVSSSNEAPKSVAPKIVSPSNEKIESVEQVEVAKPEKKIVEKSRSKLVPVIIVLLIVLILAIGGAAAAYFMGLLTLPLKNLASDEVMGRMYETVGKISSVTFTVDIRNSIQPREMESGVLETVPSSASTEQTDLQRDQQRLDDASMLLGTINDYKPSGGLGKYYPRTLLEVVPEQHKVRIEKELIDGRYGYRQERDGTGFTLHIGLETDVAWEAYQQAMALLPTSGLEIPADTSNSVNRLVALNENSQPVTVRLNGMESSVRFDEAWAPAFSNIPTKVESHIVVTGSAQTVPNQTNSAQLSAKGSVNWGDTTFDGSGEFVKAGDFAYGRLTQFPTFDFLNFDVVKNRWVEFVAAQSSSVGADSADTTANTADTEADYLRMALRLAREENVFRVVKELPRTNDEQKKSYHYQLEIDEEKLPNFYEHLYQDTLQQYGETAYVIRLKSLAETAKRDDFKQLMKMATKNSQIELWVNEKTFNPTKILYSMRYVPPDSATNLSDKQFNTTVTVGLINFNQPLTVEAPKDFITIEQATQLLRGKSELKASSLEQQVSQISEIREALRLYEWHSGQYPEKLNDLLVKPSDVDRVTSSQPLTNTEAMLGGAALEKLQKDNAPFLKNIPADVFTQQPYQYQRTGQDYSLVYAIKFPSGTEAEVDSLTELLRSRYIEGTNTATSAALSLEVVARTSPSPTLLPAASPSVSATIAPSVSLPSGNSPRPTIILPPSNASLSIDKVDDFE